MSDNECRKKSALATWLVSCSAYSLAAEPTDVWVSPDGNDANTGTSPDQPLRSVAAAARMARPGSRILLMAGTHPPMRFVELTGTRSEPISIQQSDDARGKVIVSSGRFESRSGLTLEKCRFVVVSGLHITRSLKGINVLSSENCVVQDNVIENLGQEAIHVARLYLYDGSKKFHGPASVHIQIKRNQITGTGKWKGRYGEGIYIGTDAFPGDDTHDVLIEGNTLSDISSEGIEVKPQTSRVIVRGNSVSNTYHQYNAAITIAAGDSNSADSGKFPVENNRIRDNKQMKHLVAGISIGHGKAVIRNNVIWNIEGGIGIRALKTFSNPDALQITIENKTVMAGDGRESILLNHGTLGGTASSLVADVRAKGNLTDDSSANTKKADPGQFRGPLTGNADDGRRPGPGFELNNPSRAGADLEKILRTTRETNQPERN